MASGRAPVPVIRISVSRCAWVSLASIATRYLAVTRAMMVSLSPIVSLSAGYQILLQAAVGATINPRAKMSVRTVCARAGSATCALISAGAIANDLKGKTVAISALFSLPQYA